MNSFVEIRVSGQFSCFKTCVLAWTPPPPPRLPLFRLDFFFACNPAINVTPCIVLTPARVLCECSFVSGVHSYLIFHASWQCTVLIEEARVSAFFHQSVCICAQCVCVFVWLNVSDMKRIMCICIVVTYWSFRAQYLYNIWIKTRGLNQCACGTHAHSCICTRNNAYINVECDIWYPSLVFSFPSSSSSPSSSVLFFGIATGSSWLRSSSSDWPWAGCSSGVRLRVDAHLGDRQSRTRACLRGE